MISYTSYLIFLCVCLSMAAESYQLHCPTNIPDNTTLCVPDPRNCSNYYECHSDGSEVLYTCSLDGIYLLFNPITKFCEWPEYVKCNDNDEPTCPENGEDILFPNKYNCSTYIQCTVDGIPVIKPCPEGLNFNEEKQKCDYPEEANCREIVNNIQDTDNVENDIEVGNDDIDDNYDNEVLLKK